MWLNMSILYFYLVLLVKINNYVENYSLYAFYYVLCFQTKLTTFLRNY